MDLQGQSISSIIPIKNAITKLFEILFPLTKYLLEKVLALCKRLSGIYGVTVCLNFIDKTWKNLQKSCRRNSTLFNCPVQLTQN